MIFRELDPMPPKAPAPTPRGPMNFDEAPPPAEWILKRLVSAKGIDESFRDATTAPLNEIRNVAATAVYLAVGLAEVRGALAKPEPDVTGALVVIETLIGPNPPERNDDKKPV